VAERIGYANVEFSKGRIQDLASILFAGPELKRSLITDASFGHRGRLAEELRQTSVYRKRHLRSTSLFQTAVLNLVELVEAATFQEIPRPEKRRSRRHDYLRFNKETKSRRMQADPELWSGYLAR